MTLKGKVEFMKGTIALTTILGLQGLVALYLMSERPMWGFLAVLPIPFVFWVLRRSLEPKTQAKPTAMAFAYLCVSLFLFAMGYPDLTSAGMLGLMISCAIFCFNYESHILNNDGLMRIYHGLINPLGFPRGIEPPVISPPATEGTDRSA